MTVQQLKASISQNIDEAIDKTINELNWPYTEQETVNYYELMKIFQNLRINLKECLST